MQRFATATNASKLRPRCDGHIEQKDSVNIEHAEK